MIVGLSGVAGVCHVMIVMSAVISLYVIITIITTRLTLSPMEQILGFLHKVPLAYFSEFLSLCPALTGVGGGGE